MNDAVRSFRRLILASERYRAIVSTTVGLGDTESQALMLLALRGDLGQSELACDLRLTSSALTALVDRMERQGVAERARHPCDRRRTMVRLTERGSRIAAESQECLAHALQLLAPEDLEGFAAKLVVVADDLDAVADGVLTRKIDPVPTRALSVA